MKSPIRTVCFTSFNYGEDPEAYLREVSKKCSWVLGQLEKCPTSGKPHLQAMAFHKDKSKWGFLKPNHIEPCRSPLDSVAYVTKAETRLDGPWEFGSRPTWNIKGQKKTNMELLDMPTAMAVKEGHISYKDIQKLDYAKQYMALSSRER